MENELELDLDNIEAGAEEKLKVKNRFEKLSEKVILTSKEKEKAEAEARAAGERADSLSKERDFYKDFSVNVTRYPQAAEYQDKILEKVRSGYSTEDAMVSVLNKEGKLTASTPESRPTPTPHVEGGSAPTQVFSGDKGLSDMTTDEKFKALSEMDKSGDLVQALRGR